MIKHIRFTYHVFVPLAVILFTSCSKIEQAYVKDVFAPTLYQLSSYNLSATASGQLLTFNASATSYGPDTVIFILGTWNNADGSGSTYYLGFNSLSVSKGYIGTYQLNNAVFSGENNTYTSFGTLFTYNSTSNSTISITAYDPVNKTISGTFSFAATGGAGQGNTQPYPTSIDVTNGVFTKVAL